MQVGQPVSVIQLLGYGNPKEEAWPALRRHPIALDGNLFFCVGRLPVLLILTDSGLRKINQLLEISNQGCRNLIEFLFIFEFFLVELN